MPIIPPGFAECAITLTHAGYTRPAVVTFGVELPSGASDADQVAEDAVTAFMHVTAYGQAFTNSVQNALGEARVGQDGSEPIAGVFQSTLSGGSSGNFEVPNVALLVHKRSARGGRRGRGRMFIPWILADADTDQTGGIGATPLAALQTRSNAFRNILIVAGYQLVLLHSVSGPEVTNPTTPGSPNVVTSLVVDPRVSTQRRRLGR